eukprot:Rmarinus@m.7781
MTDIIKKLKSCRNLPQQNKEVWQYTTRKLRCWVADSSPEGKPCRPVCMILANLYPKMRVQARRIPDPPESEPTSEAVLNFLLDQMKDPPDEVPQHRPSMVTFVEEKHYKALEKPLSTIGLEVQHLSEADGIESFVSSYSKILPEGTIGEMGEKPGLLGVDGVEPKHVGSLFDAAYDFYMCKPWEKIHEVQALALRVVSGNKGLPASEKKYFASVVGSGDGSVRGVGLFETLHAYNMKYLPLLPDELQQAYKDSQKEVRRCATCGKYGDDLKRCSRCKGVSYCEMECQKKDWPTHKSECARVLSGSLKELKRPAWNDRELTYLYAECTAIPFDDLDAIDRHGWKVIPDESWAYLFPLVRTMFGDEYRPRLNDIKESEAMFRAITAFVKKLPFEALPKPAMGEEDFITVPCVDGDVTVGLQYVGVIESQAKKCCVRKWTQHIYKD